MALYVKAGSSKTSKRFRRSKKSLSREGNAEELLPGIPDEISLGLIVPKLSWKTSHVLAAVSPNWLRAIRSHQVYEGRVQSHCTEKFVLLVSYKRGSALVSIRDNSCFELPPIPRDHRLTAFDLLSCQCFCLDGKLYAFRLGGEIIKGNSNSAEVYVLDLAGQRRQWLHCGRMQQPKYGFGRGQGFGYAAQDGKFYVFKHGFASEVFDPKSRSWSLRKPMPSIRYDHQVAMLGEEFLVYGGKKRFMLGGEELFPCAGNICDRSFDAESLEVYNPVEDKWRVVGCFPKSLGGQKAILFTSRGEIYAMTVGHIYFYNENWKTMQWCWYDRVEEWDNPTVIGAVQIDNGLLIGIRWSKRVGCTYVHHVSCFRSEGFRKDAVIKWEPVKFSGPFAELDLSWTNSMIPIQL